ncbi:hydrogenase expression/formation protein HypE [Campylobacter geochelonis]|uniref:Hydrogenase expression/formation protein HypE n=1 Tax=Campylobacter geochelonis TaxID=1780362 RepID=A0A128EIN1_9BACT|nr:hydrogenase expression/formation protein HypE [Campylobacter geochelonis]QKF71283.1 hydrogenase expression/formation protein HypE [Campylobacter geochelonis]CZE48123.1 hydrogenase expression/formation protein HypE [Campylobacter geochelonis]CZE49008.1 hydrogenase expression/formation protein HypE [Campylobacter geochelonis]
MDKILLSHGGGGEEMNKLINEIIFKAFENEILSDANDSAILPNFGSDMAFSTDSFVVTPLFFSGGDIGKIAVCGTVNDLSMVGAKPLYLSCSFIIEEGFELSKLKEILNSMAKTAKQSGIKIVCGDTKVVPRGKCDKIFINTAGIGQILAKDIEVKNIKKGSKILLSGDVGRHGSVILAARDEIALESELKSDCKPLNLVVEEVLKNGIKPQCMRDATRGGLSAVLNEFASASKCEILVFEEKIKVCDEVVGVCELLGFEPYELANEGTFVLVVDEDKADSCLEILRKFDESANIIGEVLGEVTGGDTARVILENAYGSQRVLELPKGELLPRIC